MQATCPHCLTVFKVSDENLKVADGYVRCGICKEVFNALEKSWLDIKKEPAAKTKIEPTIAAKAASASTSSVKKEVTPSPATPVQPAPIQNKAPSAASKPEPKPVVANASAAQPEITKPKTQATGASAKQPSPVTAPTKSAAAPNASKTEKPVDNSSRPADDNLFAGVQSKLIPDEYRIPELHNTYSFWRDLTWSIAILVLTASLFIEYTWFNRNDLIRNPQLRPLVTQFCTLTDCGTMDLRETSKIEMVTRNIYSHPNVDDALMISGTLTNHAPFEQPYPDILINFSDVRGEVIASRIFTPEDYLQIKISNLKLLTPEISIDFNMEIQDPGKNASTYEFRFL